MLKSVSVALIPLLLIISNGPSYLLTGLKRNGSEARTGILEKMIVAGGSVAMDLDLNRLNGIGADVKAPQPSVLRFDVERDSFFTVLVLDNELRGPLPSSMAIIPQNSVALPERLNASVQQLVVESMPWGEPYDLVVRDGRTGFIFFNIEGHQFDYDASQHLLSVKMGTMLLSTEFATELGRPSDASVVVGQISIIVTLRPIEVTQYANGEVKSDVLPSLRTKDGTTPGPDVVVGNISALMQLGSGGTQVGLALGSEACNFGVENVHWFTMPDNDHPVIPQNLYRMSGGATNDERFEQIGQSNAKHGFAPLAQNLCGLGCNGVGGNVLGSGCSDPTTASLNGGPTLGSRAWINPFTGFFPRGDSASPPNIHTGHTHTGTSHRILTEINDLNTTLNPGASYFAEAQYITPHEYAWCSTHPGQCNMYNNASYRRFSITGTAGPFNFAAVGATVRAQAAINAWTGATIVTIEPAPGTDGIGMIGYRVTNPSAGVWHYEYAIYNQNLDRAIQSLSIPNGVGLTLSNVEFHAPPQHPGWTFDGTVGNTGYSSMPWAQTQNAANNSWSSDTFTQNQNANAIRWGTLYNIRFDSNMPPEMRNVTISFFKTGVPITVSIQAPSGAAIPVSVSGRVTTSTGQGVANARVFIADAVGNARMAITSSFGYYSFGNVDAGGTYTIAVQSKRYGFTPQMLQVNDNMTNVDFVTAPPIRAMWSHSAQPRA